MLHFNQSCLCTGSQTTCHFILLSERSPLSLMFLYTSAAIHFKVSATPLDCNRGKKVHNVQSRRKIRKRKMRRQSKETTKFERDFLLYLERQSPHRLQRKPAHGRRLALPLGQSPTFPRRSASHHEGAGMLSKPAS